MDAKLYDQNLDTAQDGALHFSDDCQHVEMDMDSTQDENTNQSTNDVPDKSLTEHSHLSNSYSDKLDSRDSGDVEKAPPRIVQVLNVAPAASLEQLSTLFGFLGDIDNIELYQSDPNSDPSFKVCFVEFAKASSILLAQHLTNTVFIDRALIVLPYSKPKIPDREEALASASETNMCTSFNSGFLSQVHTGPGGTQVIATVDPRLTALGLPQYPHLPLNTEPARVEEIRRTVYIGNLDSTIPADQVLKFFNNIGEVKYIRMAGDDSQPTRFAFVEYTHQSSLANALQHNGFVLGSRSLKINHSHNAIVKSQPKVDQLDEPSKRMRDNSSRERHHASKYDRDRDRLRDRDRDRGDRDRDRERDRDRHRDRRISPRPSRDYKSRRTSTSRDREVLTRRRSRSRSRERLSRRSRSREILRRRSRSRDSRRRRSASRSLERNKSHRHKSSRRR